MPFTPAFSTAAYQPEQFVLLRQLAGAGTPEVVQLADQLRADAQLMALFQQPLDVRRNIVRKAPLLHRGGQPAGEKEVFLCRRKYAAILSGQRKRHQGTPRLMARFFCQPH